MDLLNYVSFLLSTSLQYDFLLVPPLNLGLTATGLSSPHHKHDAARALTARTMHVHVYFSVEVGRARGAAVRAVDMERIGRVNRQI